MKRHSFSLFIYKRDTYKTISNLFQMTEHQDDGLQSHGSKRLLVLSTMLHTYLVLRRLQLHFSGLPSHVFTLTLYLSQTSSWILSCSRNERRDELDAVGDFVLSDSQVFILVSTNTTLAKPWLTSSNKIKLRHIRQDWLEPSLPWLLESSSTQMYQATTSITSKMTMHFAHTSFKTQNVL